MPNWTSNKIRAKGTANEFDQFLDSVSGPDQPLDFNRIIPMPELLRHTGVGSDTIDGAEQKTWYVIDPDLWPGQPGYEDNKRAFTPEERAALDDIGHDNWYDWRVEHWGTKSNAYHATVERLPAESAVEISFYTAWSAPLPFFRELATRFPQLSFTCSCTNQDEPEVTNTVMPLPLVGV